MKILKKHKCLYSDFIGEAICLNKGCVKNSNIFRGGWRMSEILALKQLFGKLQVKRVIFVNKEEK